jgi:hypothetical protein
LVVDVLKARALVVNDPSRYAGTYRGGCSTIGSRRGLRAARGPCEVAFGGSFQAGECCLDAADQNLLDRLVRQQRNARIDGHLNDDVGIAFAILEHERTRQVPERPAHLLEIDASGRPQRHPLHGRHRQASKETAELDQRRGLRALHHVGREPPAHLPRVSFGPAHQLPHAMHGRPYRPAAFGADVAAHGTCGADIAPRTSRMSAVTRS